MSTTEESVKRFGTIFEKPNMKVERFPEMVHISLRLDNGGFLVSGLSREDARKLGNILSDDPEHNEQIARQGGVDFQV